MLHGDNASYSDLGPVFFKKWGIIAELLYVYVMLDMMIMFTERNSYAYLS